jgi:cyclic pyranopterin phosphate synthase
MPVNALSHSVWRLCAPVARGWRPARNAMARVRSGLHLAQHSLARHFIGVIRPHTVNLTVAITARCNQRCRGCLYERGFMPGAELPLPVMRDLLDDAAMLRVRSVRIYGGEPLLHRDLPAMVEHAVGLGLRTYVTTNGVLLGEKIDALYAAGLRDCTFGYYGSGRDYDDYVERSGNFARLERSIAAVRERYGAGIGLRMNWLLMRPTCSVAALDAAWSFAERYRTPMQVDLVHYSLPYFSEGPQHELQFQEGDLPMIRPVVERLLELKARHPDMIENSVLGLRSIPDWLLLGPAMRVPCDKYRMIWVGADGTVQLCYVTFRLGNLHEQRLSELLYTDAHRAAARDAFALRCPNCHCGFDDRVRKDGACRQRYSAPPAT